MKKIFAILLFLVLSFLFISIISYAQNFHFYSCNGRVCGEFLILPVERNKMVYMLNELQTNGGMECGQEYRTEVIEEKSIEEERILYTFYDCWFDLGKYNQVSNKINCFDEFIIANNRIYNFYHQNDILSLDMIANPQQIISANLEFRKVRISDLINLPFITYLEKGEIILDQRYGWPYSNPYLAATIYKGGKAVFQIESDTIEIKNNYNRNITVELLNDLYDIGFINSYGEDYGFRIIPEGSGGCGIIYSYSDGLYSVKYNICLYGPARFSTAQDLFPLIAVFGRENGIGLIPLSIPSTFPKIKGYFPTECFKIFGLKLFSCDLRIDLINGEISARSNKEESEVIRYANNKVNVPTRKGIFPLNGEINGLKIGENEISGNRIKLVYVNNFPEIKNL